ncbi:MAG: ABC transporter permease [Gammaproteobacteria bacterium]|nr:ABC transporter permease [Gammaproteobacteria bacterium]MCY4228586.1 ABC transporter permease [Gammaproteobacteria bacterium]MCY4312936.1 ABC transporter permease [Gammaproteobacteria bacterium]
MPRSFSVLRANIREAIDSLRKAKLRTILGLIGIMIGISSVITMISLGEIAKNQAKKQFESLGTDMVVMYESQQSIAQNGNQPLLKVEDTFLLQHLVPEISISATRVLHNGEFRFAGKSVGYGDVQGATESFAEIGQFAVSSGRFISDLDIDQYYAVIGADTAEEIRKNGTVQIVGERLDISGTIFVIIGILEPRQESYQLPMQFNANRSVFIPISTVGRAFGKSNVDSVVAKSTEGVHHERVAESIREYFTSREPNIILDVITAKQLIAQMETQAQIYTLLLAAIGSISLVVGGIGIMNIMLVSVVERRKEIGIRRALGARRRDIQGQFLIESMLQTTTGGAMGVLVGTGATYAICEFTGWEFTVSTVSIVSGLATALVMGLLFGIQPANQAARLDPIIALQSE